MSEKTAEPRRSRVVRRLRQLAGLALLAACGGEKSTEPIGPPKSWDWTPTAASIATAGIEWVRVAPGSDGTWYAGGEGGLFVSRDGGASWARPITTPSQIAVEFARDDSRLLYGVSRSLVLRSRDGGATWDTLYVTPFGYIRSLHVGRTRPGLLLVGGQIDPVRQEGPDRFYRSADTGRTWTEQPIDGGSRGLIPWDIEEDVNGVLYSGTEIYDHPQPYHPPFWRSTDGGLTWEERSGTLPWHVVSIQAHPSTPTVYALTEGAGLFRTTDAALSWIRISPNVYPPSPEVHLLIDPADPTRLYGSDVYYGAWPGGVWVSTDAGYTFHAAGLGGRTVSSLSLAEGGRTLLAVAIGSGIWRSPIPTNP